jgi:hypothetical protein
MTKEFKGKCLLQVLGVSAAMAVTTLVSSAVGAEQKARFVLELDWHGSILTDRASLQIVSEKGDSSFLLGIPGFSDDRDVDGREEDSLSITVSEGDILDLSLSPYSANVGAYDISLNCDGPDMMIGAAKVDSTGSLSATYIVPDFDKLENKETLVCKFSNTMLFSGAEIELDDMDIQAQLAADFDAVLDTPRFALNDADANEFRTVGYANEE